ncbi:MAG: hypothetical protein ACTHM6_08855 [Tepidisphaeraceae bacterium]
MRNSVVLFSLLLMAIPLAGCSPAIDAELKLIDASRHGITLVKAGVSDRQASLAAMQAAARSRLDAAFDADVKAQPQPINPDWIVDARRAYAAAIDAQTQQQLRTERRPRSIRPTWMRSTRLFRNSIF